MAQGLQWALDLLPGWFASSSSHLLLLDHHLPMPAIIKVLELVSHRLAAKVLQAQAKALFCSSELQCHPGWAHSSSGSPATSMTSLRYFLCPAGEISSSDHPCFPCSTMGQNQVADGAGRLESWGRYHWLASGTWESLQAGSPTPAFRRCQKAQDFGQFHGWRDASGPGMGRATVCQGASIPSAGLSRQVAARMHHSLAVHGDLSSAPTLE